MPNNDFVYTREEREMRGSVVRMRGEFHYSVTDKYGKILVSGSTKNYKDAKRQVDEILDGK